MVSAMLLLLLGAGLTACDGNVHHPVGPVRVTDPVQNTEAAPQDGALASAASLITKELSGDPNFGSVALEQGKLVIMWHGAESDRISRLRDELPGVDISIRSAACVPGTAMDRAGILLTEDARVRVVEMSKDGSHVVVTVSEGADNSALAAAYEAQLGCPVRLETGGAWFRPRGNDDRGTPGPDLRLYRAAGRLEVLLRRAHPLGLQSLLTPSWGGNILGLTGFVVSI
ncbi:hypothetical protein AB0O52_14165 [Arthrobacter sp. NPDC080073]|uniref:hypothetical protein n=1 Tax=Arthrobacter sp. NPDC080073 TaxID=3155919 RepID=UPI00342825C1